MRTRVQIFQPQEGQQNPVPAAVQRSREFGAQVATGFMRIHGIRSLTTTFRQVGLCAVTDVSYDPFDLDPPAALLALRNSIARKVSDLLFTYGILGMELFPNDEEMQTIKDGWQALESGTGPAATTDGSVIQEIPLNIEQDPSGKSVVETIDGTEQPKS